MIKVEVVERREQLIQSAEVVAQLAVNRKIVAQHVSKLQADHEIRKLGLDRQAVDSARGAYVLHAGVNGGRQAAQGPPGAMPSARRSDDHESG